jgi:hypothetical protein
VGAAAHPPPLALGLFSLCRNREIEDEAEPQKPSIDTWPAKALDFKKTDQGIFSKNRENSITEVTYL